MNNIHRVLETHRGILKKPLFILSIVIIDMLIIFFISSKTTKPIHNRNLEHTLVVSKMDVSGKVIEVYDEKGFTLVTLSNSSKITFCPSWNYGYKYPYLCEFILKGDSVIKRPNNDTLKILRNTDSYYFVLGKVINRNSH